MTFKYTPPEARKLWTAALRSGEYEQGTGCLRSGDRYCCLGLACELFRIHEGIGEWRCGYFYDDGGDYSTAQLTDRVEEWLGIADANGAYWIEDSEDEDDRESDSLIDENDGGTAFPGIADIIDSAPEGLFA